MPALDFDAMARLVGVQPAVHRNLRVIHGGGEQAPEPELPRSREIRPDTFDSLIGQEEAIAQILNVLEASEEDGEPAYPHMLLDGPSGVGKTTICLAIAKRRGTTCHAYAPSSLRRTDDVRTMLYKIQRGDVVLIDEIHGLRALIEESIYPAMEGLPVPLSEGSGRNRQTTTIKLPPFTLVGGTTSTGGLTEPLRNRFAVDITLRRYSDDEISRILLRAAGIKGYAMTPAGADQLALLARGTARTAVTKLLVLAYASAKKTRHLGEPGPGGELPATVIDETAVEGMMALHGYDSYGLKERDRTLLRTLCLAMHGGPIGIDKLARASGVDIKTAKEIEQYLTDVHLMCFDGLGRKATVLGYKLLSEADGKVYRPPALIVGWSRDNGFIDEAWLDEVSMR